MNTRQGWSGHILGIAPRNYLWEDLNAQTLCIAVDLRFRSKKSVERVCRFPCNTQLKRHSSNPWPINHWTIQGRPVLASVKINFITCANLNLLISRWRRYPYWLFHLRSPLPQEESLHEERSPDFSATPQRVDKINASMQFLSKLVAVLNRPKTGKTAMRGNRRPRHVRLFRLPHRAIDVCSLEAVPDDNSDDTRSKRTKCAGRSHLTPLCNPTCRALLHPRTMERLTVVSLYELYGVDSTQLALNIGYSVPQLKALPGREQMRAIFCRPVAS